MCAFGDFAHLIGLDVHSLQIQMQT